MEERLLEKSSLPRVLLVGPGFSGGGAEGRYTNIVKYLFNGQNDAAVLVNRGLVSVCISGEIVDLGWTGRFSYPKLIFVLCQRLRRHKYDVVMAFGLFPNIVTVLASLFARADTKLIISEITRPKMEPTSWRSKVYSFLRRFLYHRSSVITANSIDGLKETCELADVCVEDGVRVFNVIDYYRLLKMSVERIDASLPQGKYAICVTRLDFMKRVDTIIDAFSILASQVDCKLVIVGDGDARSSLEEQIEYLALNDSVFLTGRLSNPYPLLRNAACFVLASEYEGFSNSILEAMFIDVPVITSLCSSDAHEMCNLSAALGFDVGDYEKLAEHVATLMNDELISQELVRNAQAYCANHTIENSIPLYEDIILKVANS